MSEKRKLEAQFSEPAESSQKQKQTTEEEEEQQLIKNQEDVEEVEHEEELEDDDDEEDDVDEDGNNQTTGNRTEAAATSGPGNQGDGDDDDDDETIKDLLEPFSKELLLSLLKEAAEKHLDVANRIREVADEDPGHRKIFVHGLDLDTRTETLIEAFKQYGEIEDCKAVYDWMSGKSKGYGFILYKFRSSARHALKQPQKKIGSRMASCQLASKGPVFGPGKQKHHHNPHSHNNPQYQRYDNNGYGTSIDYEHLMAEMGGPSAQVLNPAIEQALIALLASQGAGLSYYPAIGQPLLGSYGTATGVNPRYGIGMPTGYGTQAMAPGTIPGYGTQPGVQGGYEAPQLGQDYTGRGQHGVWPDDAPYMGQ